MWQVGCCKRYPGLVGRSDGVQRRLDDLAKVCPSVVPVRRGISAVVIRVGEVSDEHRKLGAAHQQRSASCCTAWRLCHCRCNNSETSHPRIVCNEVLQGHAAVGGLAQVGYDACMHAHAPGY